MSDALEYGDITSEVRGVMVSVLVCMMHWSISEKFKFFRLPVV